MGVLCGLFGYTYQGYHKHEKNLAKENMMIDKIIREVKLIRADQPRVGARKLQFMLSEKGIFIGRDKLFNILRDHDMLSTVYRRKCRTSLGKRSKHPNLIKSLGSAKYVGEIIASDITYLKTRNGYVYLSLTSDHYSDSILGFSLQKTMDTTGPLAALHQAMVKLKGITGIHHSDHGSQYTSNEFQKALNNYDYLTSMTGIGRCYDNAKAERINGILKHELGLDKTFFDYKEALLYVKDAIRIYNEDRVIITKGYRTPNEIIQAA